MWRKTFKIKDSDTSADIFNNKINELLERLENNYQWKRK